MRPSSLALGAALIFAVGCHDAGPDGGPDGGLDLAGPDLAGPDLAPIPAPYGLDSRPPNPSCLAPARPPGPPSAIALESAFPAIGFSAAVGLYQRPGDPSRLYVVEQGGAVKTFPNSATVTPAMVTTVLTLPQSDVPSIKPGSIRLGAGEGGLLSMAFDPAFATTKRVYLSYTSPGDLGTNGNNLHSVLSRVTSADDGLSFIATSEEILLQQHQFADNHNGGNIAFGPDGYLYMGLGDGGGGGDPQEQGQDTATLLGKMLRLDVSGAGAYAIPPGNPFSAATDSSRKEIFAWGLRNPWRWSFDRANGDLWVGDVGQDAWEEIDKVVLGGNYGWDEREGAHCYEPATNCATAGLIDPIVEYPHADGDRSVVGGFVYRGSAIPSLVGTYLFADTYTGRIWSIAYDPITAAPSRKELLLSGLTIYSFAQLEDGEIYVLALDGKIYRIIPAGPPAADTFPKTLSATGCVDPSDPRQPAPGLIPYEVNAPLWSDGATKRRWMALPDGAQIQIGADGDWDFPNGTVLVKEFSLGGQRLETRLMVRHDDGGWAGYSYEWDDQEKDAALLPAGKTRAVSAGSWTYPSRGECLSCHTEAAGRSLGPETGQLNGDAVYPSTNRLSNQLATLDHIGLFATPLPGPPATLARVATYGGADPLETRARAYLHVNCGNCHRPNGPGRGPADFRFAQSLQMVGVCGADPTEGDLGIAGAKLLTPGSPSTSIISRRMHALDAQRMPPLGTRLVDPTGTKLIDDWIGALTSCP